MCGQIVVKPTMSPSGPTPPGTLLAELQEDAGRVGVRVGHLQGLVGLEVVDAREAVRRIAQPSKLRARLRALRNDGRGGGAGRGDARSRQEPPTADIDLAIAPFHALLPLDL